MKICTLALKLFVEKKKAPRWIAEFMQQSQCLNKALALERILLKVCEDIGIPFCFIQNEYGEETGVIEAGILSRKPPQVFFELLEKLLSNEVP
jgi:hypothetical protein